MGMTLIGDALKAHRTKNDLTQVQLADRLRCSQGLLARWEQGSGLPSKYATAIGREFGWTMAELDSAMEASHAQILARKRAGAAVSVDDEDTDAPPVEVPARAV